ncbi:alpha/beta hydrolase, partial [Rhizobium sp. TRM95111]|nr:alpha/beta hydrolase [Rhizobium alarense]
MAQSTAHCVRRRIFAVLAAALWPAAAMALTLAPFKDELFAYPAAVETADGGALTVVDYREARDINDRDQTPERRVRSAYVSLEPKRQQENLTVATPAGAVEVTRVGRGEGAAFTVIFIHGRGGDRRLGANDWSFGGNFNRLKNLAVRNGGV